MTGYTLTGTDEGNYTLTGGTHVTNITKKAITVTATAADKAYDGTITATVTLADNRITGDVLTDSYISAAFASPNVGTGITVTVTGIAISGTNSTNYALSSTTATTTANIGASKEPDGGKISEPLVDRAINAIYAPIPIPVLLPVGFLGAAPIAYAPIYINIPYQGESRRGVYKAGKYRTTVTAINGEFDVWDYPEHGVERDNRVVVKSGTPLKVTTKAREVK